MDITNRKLSVFKAVDRISAVLTSLLTAAYLSALIFLVLSERLGHTRVLAVITRMFPSRELESVTLVLISLIVAGAVTMLSFSENKLSFLVAVNGILSVIASVFFLVYTKTVMFVIVLVVGIIYLLLGVLRALMLSKHFDQETYDEKEL